MDLAPPDGDDWLGLARSILPVTEALTWAESSRCGAVVLFSGLVRDHSPGRDAVSGLEYEAYEEEVVPHMVQVVGQLRASWPEVGRVAMLHRIGSLGVGESAVVVVVAAPHRAEAFEAARFAIDTLKASVPIWKRETWAGGQEWSGHQKSMIS